MLCERPANDGDALNLEFSSCPSKVRISSTGYLAIARIRGVGTFLCSCAIMFHCRLLVLQIYVRKSLYTPEMV
jgi:hypothetical protein